MRTSYLVCYDIKLMRGYGDDLHYSAFECQLTASDRVQRAAEAIILRENAYACLEGVIPRPLAGACASRITGARIAEAARGLSLQQLSVCMFLRGCA